MIHKTKRIRWTQVTDGTWLGRRGLRSYHIEHDYGTVWHLHYADGVERIYPALLWKSIPLTEEWTHLEVMARAKYHLNYGE